jgi:hypothetical protein
VVQVVAVIVFMCKLPCGCWGLFAW